MDLATYLTVTEQTQTAFAEKAGVPVPTINRAIRKGIVPSVNSMRKIYEASGGLVTPNDLFAIQTASSRRRRAA